MTLAEATQLFLDEASSDNPLYLQVHAGHDLTEAETARFEEAFKLVEASVSSDSSLPLLLFRGMYSVGAVVFDRAEVALQHGGPEQQASFDRAVRLQSAFESVVFAN